MLSPSYPFSWYFFRGVDSSPKKSGRLWYNGLIKPLIEKKEKTKKNKEKQKQKEKRKKYNIYLFLINSNICLNKYTLLFREHNFICVCVSLHQCSQTVMYKEMSPCNAFLCISEDILMWYVVHFPTKIVLTSLLCGNVILSW